MSMRSIVVAGLLLAGQAHGAEPSDRTKIDAAARGHVELGSQFYNEGRLEAARIEFLAAYDLTSHADLLHNLSLIAERREEWADAVRYEEQFLSAPRSSGQLPLSQREIDEAQGRLARLRAKLSAKPASAPDSPPRPVTQQNPQSSPRERRSPPAGSIGLMIGGGIVLAVGLGCGAGALATRAAVNDPAGVYSDQYDPLVSRGQALNRATIALDAIGGVTLAIGAGWALWARLKAPKVVDLASDTKRYSEGLIVRSRPLIVRSSLDLVPTAADPTEQM